MVAGRTAMLLSLVVWACGKAPAPADAVVAAWGQAGLAPTGFQKMPVAQLGARSCHAGVVSGVDATLCEYADAAKAKAAEVAGVTAIGETTGVSLSAGNLLLVLADRRKADPSGRSINALAQVFQKQRR